MSTYVLRMTYDTRTIFYALGPWYLSVAYDKHRLTKCTVTFNVVYLQVSGYAHSHPLKSRRNVTPLRHQHPGVVANGLGCQ